MYGRLRIVSAGTILLFQCLAASAALCQTPTTGSLQGTVADQSGKALAGVIVTATFTGPGRSHSHVAISSNSGGFAVPRLSPGPYSVCANAPGAPYLDPCTWSGPLRVTVAAGQSAAAALRLAKGSILRVRLKDPNKQLAEAAEGAPDEVLVGVFTPVAMFRPLRRISAEADERRFEITIPAGTPVRLSVSSGKVTLVDQSGRAVTAATAVSVQQAPDVNYPDMVLTVSGRK